MRGKKFAFTTQEFVPVFAQFIVDMHFVDDIQKDKRLTYATTIATAIYDNIITVERDDVAGWRKFQIVLGKCAPQIRKLGSHALKSAAPYLIQLAVYAIYHTKFAQYLKWLPLLQDLLKALGVGVSRDNATSFDRKVIDATERASSAATHTVEKKNE